MSGPTVKQAQIVNQIANRIEKLDDRSLGFVGEMVETEIARRKGKEATEPATEPEAAESAGGKAARRPRGS